jgi:hypothetical protein
MRSYKHNTFLFIHPQSHIVIDRAPKKNRFMWVGAPIWNGCPDLEILNLIEIARISGRKPDEVLPASTIFHFFLFLVLVFCCLSR